MTTSSTLSAETKAVMIAYVTYVYYIDEVLRTALFYSPEIWKYTFVSSQFLEAQNNYFSSENLKENSKSLRYDYESISMSI